MRTWILLLSAAPLFGSWSGAYYEGSGSPAIPVANLPWGLYTHYTAQIYYPNGDCTINSSWGLTAADAQTFITSAHTNNAKALFSIIGMSAVDSSPSNFGTCTDSSHLSGFVTNLMAVLNGSLSNGAVWDGVDLDWENSVNYTQYQNLIAAMRSALDNQYPNPKKLLTTATYQDFGSPGLPSVAANQAAHLDQVNVMCYDLDFWDSSHTWFVSSYNAYGGPQGTCQAEMTAFTSAGVAAAKLGVGLAFYGRIWTGTSQPNTSGSRGGELAYGAMVTDSSIWQTGYKNHDTTHLGAYLAVTGSGGACPSAPCFIPYTDTWLVDQAVSWMKTGGYGGIFSYDLNKERVPGASGQSNIFPLSAQLAASLGSGGSAPSITTASLPNVTVNTAYSQTVMATGDATVTWTITSGSLPVGLSGCQNTTGNSCTISGTPTSAGSFGFTLRAANSIGSANQSYTVKVWAEPFAYWTLDDGSGSSASDSSGNGDTLTLTNTPSWQTGTNCAKSGCVAFNGTNQSAQVALDLSETNVVTLAFWMKWNSYTTPDALSLEFTANYNNAATGFIVNPSSSRSDCGTAIFEVGLHGNAGYNQACFTRPSAGGWHHYAFIFSTGNPAATEVIPYVDGVAVAYTKPANSQADNTNNFGNDTLYWMSRAASSLFAAGSLDELYVYKRALSQAEITALMGVTNDYAFSVTPSDSNAVSGSAQALSIHLTSQTNDYGFSVTPTDSNGVSGSAGALSIHLTSSQPIAGFDGISHEFGSVMVGVQTGGFTFTLTNTGNAVLAISSIAPSGDFSESSNCPISPSTLGIGSSCTITARFLPTAVGLRSGTVTVTDNAANSPQTLTLTGTGTPQAAGSIGTGISAGRVIVQ